MVTIMKNKKFRVLRPEIEFECTRPILGRMLIPFYSLLVYLKCFRVATITLTLSGKLFEKYKALIVPKITVVDAL